MKTEPRHEYRDLEKLGFLCRWFLLTLSVAVILIASWAAIAGSIAVSSGSRTTMTLSDAVWRQGSPRPALRGFLNGPASIPQNIPRFIFQNHSAQPKFALIHQEHNEVFAIFDQPAPRTHKVTISGIPYGPMAFNKGSAVLRIVPDIVTVYILDAQFLAAVERDDPQTAGRLVSQFSRIGQAVIALPGPDKSIDDLLDRLKRYDNIPRVFSLRKNSGSIIDLINSLTAQLRCSSKTKPEIGKPFVITNDIDTAMKAARRGHYTHLVTSKKTPPKPLENIRLHATAGDLADHIANESPPHVPIQ